MKQFPTRAASNIVAGFILAALAAFIWAGTRMTAREWRWFALFAASVTLLIYGRTWLRRLFGFHPSGCRKAGKPNFGLVGERERLHEAKTHNVIYKRLEATFKANGRAPHPTRTSKLETRNRP